MPAYYNNYPEPPLLYNKWVYSGASVDKGYEERGWHVFTEYKDANSLTKTMNYNSVSKYYYHGTRPILFRKEDIIVVGKNMVDKSVIALSHMKILRMSEINEFKIASEIRRIDNL